VSARTIALLDTGCEVGGTEASVITMAVGSGLSSAFGRSDSVESCFFRANLTSVKCVSLVKRACCSVTCADSSSSWVSQDGRLSIMWVKLLRASIASDIEESESEEEESNVRVGRNIQIRVVRS